MENQEMQSPQMPMGMPVPEKRKDCCKGLKILAIILGVLVLGLACLSIVLLMKKDGERATKSESVGENSEVEDELGEVDDEVEDILSPTYSYFHVERWGVKFKIPNGLFNVNSYQHQMSGDSEGFAANGLLINPGGINSCDFGGLVRWTSASEGAGWDINDEIQESAVKVGDFYFSYLMPGGSRSSMDCLSENARTIELIKQMLSQPVLID